MSRHICVRRRLAIGTLAVATSVALVACGNSSPASNGGGSGSSGATSGKTTVSVGVLPIADVAPLYLGMKQGFFAKQHLSLTPHTLQGGAAAASAVVGGSLQFGFGATANLVQARSHGLPLEFVANGDQAGSNPTTDWSGILVRKGSSITSITGLAGRTVAANATKGENELALDSVLLKAGVSPSSVHVVALPFPTMPTALAAGQVDAVTEVEPFVSAILAKGGVRLSALFAAEQPSQIVSGYFATSSYIKSHADVVKRFAAAMEQSLAYAQANPAAVRAIIPTYTSIPGKVAAKMKLPTWSPAIDTSSIQAQEQLMQKLKWISAPVPVSQLVWSGARR